MQSRGNGAHVPVFHGFQGLDFRQETQHCAWLNNTAGKDLEDSGRVGKKGLHEVSCS